ncbi:GNAT family N-acetyltransferase [Brevibacterium aurantiacum]|uniref:GNAT family N-acetyltransferase n=1 Tax=Brevibacterium aurantiacum TaxID=273384 RepID=UPI00049509F3|nr:GNAT family N-acetyltransferase [Brevibacterium aurantiacum]
MPPNATPRLRFREMSPDDLDEMADLLGDPQVMEYYPRPKDREETATWINWNQRNYAQYGHGLWIIETHDGEFIGDCGLTWQTVNEAAALEVGFHVKASAQNLGFAAEAATACRDFASSHALASRLVAIIHHDNRPSQRVAAKIGMHRDRTLTHSSPIHLVYAMDL